MTDATPPEAVEHEFEEISAAGQPTVNLSLDDLAGVPLTVSADLGHSPMRIRDILKLKVGSVVPLDKLAGEMTDVYINGKLLAKGEVVPIGDTLHVRIQEVLGAEEDNLSEPTDAP